MTLRHLLPILALLAFHTEASAQVLSPVQHLPGDDAVAAAAFDQQNPAIARGGDQFLTVWMDYRTTGDALIPDEGDADVYAARLDANGNLLDTVPIPISVAGGPDTYPKVAWNGTNWLVTWIVRIPTQFFYESALRAVRVSPSGQVLDAQPIAVYDGSGEFYHTVTSDGTNWAVAVEDEDTQQTKGVRIAADGTVLDPGGVTLATDAIELILVYAQGTYLLVYSDLYVVRGRRFSTALQPLGGAFTIASTTASFMWPDAASNGTDFYVIWRDDPFGTSRYHIEGARVTPAGAVLDPGGDLLFDGFQGFGNPDKPRVAWDGTNWLTTYRGTPTAQGEAYRATRVSAAGTVLDPGGVAVMTGDYPQQVETDSRPGGGVQLVHMDENAGGPTPRDIYTFGISPALVAGPEAVVSNGAPAQVQPDVATSGSGSLVAYLSEVSGQRRVKVHPLDAAGNPLLAEPVVLATGPLLDDPKVAWDGTRYLVVWEAPNGVSGYSVYGRRVAPDGTPIDAAPLLIMNGFNPDVAANEGVFLVADIQFGSSTQIQLVYTVRVDGATGSVLGAPTLAGTNHARHVSVVGTGTRWLLAYQRNISHDNPNAYINANFVEADGTAGAPFQVYGFAYRPEVAWNGANGLAVYHDGGEILGARVFDDRTFSSTFTVADAPSTQDRPVVAWDDEQYVTLYEDLRETTFFVDERSDVYGTRLSATGAVLDPAGFPVYSDPLSEREPSLTGANGVALLAASDFREAAPYAAYRVAYRFLGATSAPPVAVAAQPVGGPVVIGPDGGAFAFAVTLTNTTNQAQTFQAWSTVTGPVDRNPVVGPTTVTLPAGATLTRTLTQRVPGNAPAGLYTYTVNVGAFPGGVLASDSFPFTVQAARVAAAAVSGASADWSASGWEEATAAARLPGGFALSDVYPNPSRGRAHLTLEVSEAQAVTVEVYDGLGRRVAVLQEGPLAAGTHAFTLEPDASGLPAGAYVVRVTGEAFSAVRRATLMR